jgi:2'-5' RNA ligase
MRLFIAIDINDDVRKAVAKLQQDIKSRLRNQNGLKWVNPELMHLTLKFLGEADESRIDEINSAVEIACADKKAFEFSFLVVGTFGRPISVLWLGSERPSDELAKLAGDIEQTLEELGFEKEQRPFSAHLTLARVKGKGVDRNLYQLLKDYPQAKIPPILMDSVRLYKSQLTSDGPVYTLLREIELNPVRDKES